MAEDLRAQLRAMAKRANQRLVRLERAKKAGKLAVQDALLYAHRALGQVGRRRFEESSKTMSDKEVAAAMRRVSRFLNMETSTIPGQRKAKERWKEYQKYQKEEEKRRKEKWKKAKEGETPFTGGGLQSPADRGYNPKGSRERFYQAFNALKHGTIGKRFSYQTIAAVVSVGMSKGKSTAAIFREVARMEENDELTRDKLLSAFGADAEDMARQRKYVPWQQEPEPAAVPSGGKRTRKKRK